MIRLIIILCLISFLFADDGKNNMYDTSYSTDKAVETFPYYRKTVQTMPKIIYLKNLFELNCLKQIMKNSNFKNSSQNQTNKEFNPVLPLQQNNQPYFNTTRRMVNPAGNKHNQLADKFLLIPAGRDYDFLSNKKRNNLQMYNLMNNQKRVKENKVMEPSKSYFKKEIRKDNTIQRTSPQVFPQIGYEEESVNNFKPNILRLNSSINDKPTLSGSSQSNSRYKSVLAKPQTFHSYEVKEVFQDEEKADKQNEGAWEKIKAFEKIPQKPSLDVNANIFDMISKILQSGTSSKSTPENEVKLFKNDLKTNKKSKLDEEIWEGSKSEMSNNKNSPESKSPMKTFIRNEYLKEKNFKGNKENKNLNEGYEKPRRNERPNGNQNLAVRPNSGVSTSGSKRISPPLSIQTPVFYKPKLRHYFTTTFPTTITESFRLQNPNISKFFREKQAKLENENIQPSSDLSRRNYRYPMPRKAEFQNNIRNTSFAGVWQYGRNAQVVPQDAERIKSSLSNTTTKTFFKSMKFYSQTTFPNPLLEVTENPSRFEDLSKPTDVPTNKEESLKNGRKMHFVKEKENMQSQNKKQKIIIDQRRSDIPIEEDVDTANQISAINFLKLNTNDTSKLTFDTIPNEFLVSIIPMVIDDLRKNRVSSENAVVFSKIFGKYWQRVKELSKDVNLDVLPLLKIRNKKDFKKFFDNLNVTETHSKKNNSNDSDNFDDYDYIEEFKEIYKDVLFQDLQENTNKMRKKRNSKNNLKDLDETRQLFEHVQEEENEIDYLYEHFYLNKPSVNEGNGNMEDFISFG